CLQDYNTPRTF
nr:immunoglobulin light chain junction region [Macaca mulatta]